MRIYLDICAIQRPLDDLSQLRVRLESEAIVSILELCEAGALELVSSAAHQIENRQNPHLDRKAHTSDVLALATRHVRTTPEVAARFQAEGIRQLDAFHLAAAVEASADYFCTTDDRLFRRGQRTGTGTTTVVSPLDLITALP